MLKNTGQSLTEYILIGALIAVLSIGALVSLGSNVGGVLEALLNDMGGSGGSGKASSGSNAISKAAIGGAAGAGALPESGKVTLSNGEQIALPDGITDLGLMIETTGANGATSTLAQTIGLITEKMLATGEITPAQASQLAELANYGHSIAAQMTAIEAAAAKGDKVKMGDLSLELDDSIYLQGEQDRKDMEDTLKGMMKKAEANGALSNPQVADTVEYLVDDIIAVLQVTADVSYQSSQGIIAPEDVLTEIVNNDTIVDADSAAICSAGGGTDSGTQCP